MSKEREVELLDIIESQKHLALGAAVKELLSIKRERYRDKLESGEDQVARGRSKECKDLMALLS